MICLKRTVLESSYISAFCMELHLIVRAGIPFQDGVALLMEDEQNQSKKEFLQQLYQYLEQGETLADAFRLTEGLPHYAVEMVAIGQHTGHLESVFYALAGYYERLTELKQSIHNIIWYPVLLLSMMLFVMLILLIKVMPIFADIYMQLGAVLSPAAQLMLQVGQLLGQYGLNMLFVFAAAVLLLFAYSRTERGAVGLKRVGYRITANWKVRQLLTASRLADALVLTVSSGMNLDDALEQAGHLVEEENVQEKIASCKKAMLLDGKSFADAAMEQQLFAPVYCRMIAVGFRTGDMDSVLTEVARRIANDADAAMDALLNRIEPALVVLLSLMVGIILLSVMLPLMGIMTAIG